MEPQRSSNLLERNGEYERLLNQYRTGLNLYVEALGQISDAERQLRALPSVRNNLSELTTELREIEISFGLHCFKTNVELEALVKHLSDRELEVFELLGRGVTTHQIAACLKLAPSTIETYRERLKTKLNVTSAAELERQAFLWTFQRRSDLSSTNPII